MRNPFYSDYVYTTETDSLDQFRQEYENKLFSEKTEKKRGNDIEKNMANFYDVTPPPTGFFFFFYIFLFH